MRRHKRTFEQQDRKAPVPKPKTADRQPRLVVGASKQASPVSKPKPKSEDQPVFLIPGAGERILPLPRRIVHLLGMGEISIRQGIYEYGLDATRKMGDLGIGQYDRLEKKCDTCGQHYIFVLFSESGVYYQVNNWQLVEVDPARPISCDECRGEIGFVSDLFCSTCHDFTGHDFCESLGAGSWTWTCKKCGNRDRYDAPRGSAWSPRIKPANHDHDVKLCEGCKVNWVPAAGSVLCKACKERTDREQVSTVRNAWVNAFFTSGFGET